MSIPILFMYAVGTIFFMFGFEDLENFDYKSIILLGISFFTNLIAFYLSFTSTDYTQASYYPVALLALTTLMLIYSAIKMIPTENFTGGDEE